MMAFFNLGVQDLLILVVLGASCVGGAFLLVLFLTRKKEGPRND